jgi:MinD-like ATPase involved in chromosome partitioning or flagellar assembly
MAYSADANTVDGIRQAAATLDWLRQNGYQHLLARACVVINHLIAGTPTVDVADLVRNGSSATSRLDGS